MRRLAEDAARAGREERGGWVVAISARGCCVATSNRSRREVCDRRGVRAMSRQVGCWQLQTATRVEDATARLAAAVPQQRSNGSP